MSDKTQQRLASETHEKRAVTGEKEFL